MVLFLYYDYSTKIGTGSSFKEQLDVSDVIIIDKGEKDERIVTASPTVEFVIKKQMPLKQPYPQSLHSCNKKIINSKSQYGQDKNAIDLFFWK